MHIYFQTAKIVLRVLMVNRFINYKNQTATPGEKFWITEKKYNLYCSILSILNSDLKNTNIRYTFPMQQRL